MTTIALSNIGLVLFLIWIAYILFTDANKINLIFVGTVFGMIVFCICGWIVTIFYLLTILIAVWIMHY